MNYLRNLGLRGTLTLAANIVLLEVLQGTILRDGLLDVCRGSILHRFASHRAGQHQREGVTALGGLGLALGGNRGSTLGLSFRSLSILDISIHGINLTITIMDGFRNNARENG